MRDLQNRSHERLYSPASRDGSNGDISMDSKASLAYLIKWINAPVTDGQYAGFTALHFAIQSSNFDMFLLLISAGADVTYCLKNGVNSLHLAAQSNNIKAAHYLISEGLISCNSQDQ